MSTPNMNLTLPFIGGDFNNWGSELNGDLSAIDLHDHTTGKGVKVPTAGLNINADLSFNGFSAISLNIVNTTVDVAPGLTEIGLPRKGFITELHTNDPNNPSIAFAKSRGSRLSPSVVQDGDGSGIFSWYSYDGTNYLRTGFIDLNVLNPISTGVVPSTMSFAIFANAGVPAIGTPQLSTIFGLGSDSNIYLFQDPSFPKTNLLFSVDGRGDIGSPDGGSTFERPGSIWAATQVVSPLVTGISTVSGNSDATNKDYVDNHNKRWASVQADATFLDGQGISSSVTHAGTGEYLLTLNTAVTSAHPAVLVTSNVNGAKAYAKGYMSSSTVAVVFTWQLSGGSEVAADNDFSITIIDQP